MNLRVLQLSNNTYLLGTSKGFVPRFSGHYFQFDLNVRAVERKVLAFNLEELLGRLIRVETWCAKLRGGILRRSNIVCGTHTHTSKI